LLFVSLHLFHLPARVRFEGVTRRRNGGGKCNKTAESIKKGGSEPRPKETLPTPKDDPERNSSRRRHYNTDGMKKSRNLTLLHYDFNVVLTRLQQNRKRELPMTTFSAL